MENKRKVPILYIAFLLLSVCMFLSSVVGLSAMNRADRPSNAIKGDSDSYAQATPPNVKPQRVTETESMDDTFVAELPDSVFTDEESAAEDTVQTVDTTVIDTSAGATDDVCGPHTVEQVVYVDDPLLDELVEEEIPFVRNQEVIYGALDPYAVPLSDRKDDEFFVDAVFVGDSRTQGIQYFGNIDSATYYAYQGLNVISALKTPVINEYEEEWTVVDALGVYQEYRKIYVSFGTNEYYFTESKYREKYAELIDSIMGAVHPDAKIYILATFPVWDGMEKGELGLSNEKMIQFNRIAIELAKERGLAFVDVSEAFVKPDGYRYLYEEESPDGVHLNRAEVIKLCEYIRTHT